MFDSNVSVMEACLTMTSQDFSCVIVTEDNKLPSAKMTGAIVGIFTERDLCARVVAAGRDPEKTSLSQVMTRGPDCIGSEAHLSEALNKMLAGKYRHLPVTDETGKALGVLDIASLSHRTLLKGGTDEGKSDRAASRPKSWMSLFAGSAGESNLEKLAKEGLATLPDTDSALDAATLMMTMHVSAVAIVDRSGTLCGIFSERDLLRRVVAKKLDPKGTLLSAVMTRNPVSVTNDTDAMHALSVMAKGHFRHLPVVAAKGGRLIGILDILHVVMESFSSSSTSSSASQGQQHGAEKDKHGAGEHAKSGWFGRAMAAILSGGFAEESDSEDSEGQASPDETRNGERVRDVLASLAIAAAPLVPGVSRTPAAPVAEQSASNPAPSTVTWKISLDDTTYRITTTTLESTITSLLARVSEASRVDAVSLSLSYKDDENDIVSLSSDADVREASKLYLSLGWNCVRVIAKRTDRADAAAKCAPVTSNASETSSKAAKISSKPSEISSKTPEISSNVNFLELEVEGNEAMQSGNTDVAINRYKRALENIPEEKPDHRARILLKLLNVHSIDNNFSECSLYLSSLSLLLPQIINKNIYIFGMCQIYSDMNNVEKAIELAGKIDGKEAEKAEKFIRDQADQFMERGMRERDFTLSVNAFTTVIRYTSNDKWGWQSKMRDRALYERSKAYKKIGDIEMEEADLSLIKDKSIIVSDSSSKENAGVNPKIAELSSLLSRFSTA